jgi:hypothetical protein
MDGGTGTWRMDQLMEKNGEWRMMEEGRENGKEEGRAGRGRGSESEEPGGNERCIVHSIALAAPLTSPLAPAGLRAWSISYALRLSVSEPSWPRLPEVPHFATFLGYISSGVIIEG